MRIRPIDARPALLARVLVYGNLLPHSHVSPRTHRSAFSVLLNHTRPTPSSPHRISETYSAAAMADEMTCLVRDCTNVGIYAIRGNECQEITSQVGRRPLDRADASIEFDTKVIDMVAGAPLVTRCRAEDTDSARGLLPAKLVGLKINDPDGAEYSGTITDILRYPESGPFEGNVVQITGDTENIPPRMIADDLFGEIQATPQADDVILLTAEESCRLGWLLSA